MNQSMARSTERSKQLERWLEALVVIAAVITIPVVVLQEQGIDEVAVSIADWAIWIVFTVDFIVLAILAPNRLAYLKSHWLNLAVVVVSFPLLSPLLGLARLARVARFMRL